MEVKFGKGSEEWMMFTDFWQLCQKYWETENNDSYWDNLMKDANLFYEKYKDITLSEKLTMAFIDTQEIKFKEKEK